MMLSSLLGAELPGLGTERERLWPEALKHACFIHRILPNRGNPNNKSPFEMETGAPPPYKRMRLIRWGCRVSIQLSSDIRAWKFSSHVRHGYMVGYEEAAAWGTIRVYCPDTGRIVVTDRWYSDPGISDIRPQPVVLDDCDHEGHAKASVPPPPPPQHPAIKTEPNYTFADGNGSHDPYFDDDEQYTHSGSAGHRKGEQPVAPASVGQPSDIEPTVSDRRKGEKSVTFAEEPMFEHQDHQDDESSGVGSLPDGVATFEHQDDESGGTDGSRKGETPDVPPELEP